MPSNLPNILIVDDNTSYLLYLEIILFDVKANIYKAESGPQALEIIKDVEISMAILDVHMPIMNGFELALKLNAKRTGNKIPIIFLTSDSPVIEKMLKGYESGAVDYIIKSLNKKVLISKINVFLELFWQKQQLIEKTEKLKQSEKELLLAKEQLEQVNEHLIKAIEEERTNISYKVHDELGQSITALKMDLKWVRNNLHEKDMLAGKLDNMIEITNEVISKVQHIAAETHPGILDDLGLVVAIEWYCKDFEERTGIPCTLYLEEVTPLKSSINLAIFRVLQEALTNVIRHAHASAVTIQLFNNEHDIIMKIADDGTGIPTDKLSSPDSFGIMSMRQRIRQCKGIINFTNTTGSGLSIEIKIPQMQLNYEYSYSR
jgi:signal transduction histidine kinase